jgi:hypothetical protein
LPKKSFISLRGLPPTVSLSHGYAIGVGSWTVPTTALATLKANIPDNVSGRSEIIISLISMEGSLLAMAKTELVVGPPAAGPLGKKGPPAPPPTIPAVLPPAVEAPAAPVSPAPAPSSPSGQAVAEPSKDPANDVAPPAPAQADRFERGGKSTFTPREVPPEERQLAEKLVAQGDRYLAQADVGSARLLFRRAAEKGFAPAAIRLAATYDPAELARLHIEGVTADQAEARKWYERARELGAPEAEERLARLGGR